MLFAARQADLVTDYGMLFTALLGCEFHFYMCFLKCSRLTTIGSGDNLLTEH